MQHPFDFTLTRTAAWLVRQRRPLTTLGCALALTACSSTATNTTTLQPSVTTANTVTVEAPVKQSSPKEMSDVWQRIQHGLQLDLAQQHPRIESELRWLVNNDKYFDQITDRAAPYLHFIVEEAEKMNVPLELALLPVVESSFDPFAYSHAGASGLWQFMPATGRQYKLQQNWWYDGRRDIILATRAALKYMKSIHKQFDDWELALASFNSGPGRVARAVEKNRKQGKSTRFWDLDLPRETTQYVPKLIAIAKVIQNPEKYGVSLTPIANQPHFECVNIGSQLDMAKASQLSGVPLDNLYKLNPALNRWATSPDGPHYLLVPVENAEMFRDGLSKLSKADRLNWTRYVVKEGDNLSTIAKANNTSVKAISSANSLNGTIIRIGQSLLIPTAGNQANHYKLALEQRRARQQNRAVSGRTRTMHTVQAGDTFWSLSRQYDITMSELARWNDLSPRDTLRINQQLAVWQKGASSVLKGNGVIRKVTYTIKSGDSLARIANKFNVKIAQIKEWNTDLRGEYIQPGQMVTLYVDVTK